MERIEDLITPLIGDGVVGYRTDIAQSRGGSAVEENVFRMTIEIVPAEQRERPHRPGRAGLPHPVPRATGSPSSIGRPKCYSAS
ncbi:MAG: hypothetical protein O3C57_01325 [Verrucomicrobia bacterium]|nr:hypothetical protein [Verrucomicrobiota bacterium]